MQRPNPDRFYSTTDVPEQVSDVEGELLQHTAHVIRRRILRRTKVVNERLLASMAATPTSPVSKASVVEDLSGSDSDDPTKPAPPHSIFHRPDDHELPNLIDLTHDKIPVAKRPTFMLGETTVAFDSSTGILCEDVPVHPAMVTDSDAYYHGYRRAADKQKSRGTPPAHGTVQSNINMHTPRGLDCRGSHGCSVHMSEVVYRAIQSYYDSLHQRHQSQRQPRPSHKSTKSKCTIVLEEVD